MNGRLGSAFEALRNRGFRWWFLSQVLSSSGGATQSVGQAWLVLRLHGGSVQLALAGGALFLPTLIFGIPLGGLSDRYDRRAILIATQCLMVAIAGALAVLTWAGAISIPLLIGLALAMGTVVAVDSPARQVYALDLVGGSRVANAISLNEVVLNGSRVLGPAVGGLALAAVGPWLCFGVNALSFLPALAVLLARRRRETAPVPRARQRGARRDGLRDGIRVPAVRACLLIAVAAGAVINIAILMPLMAVRVFHVGGAQYGIMLAVFGLGAIPGALMSAAGRSEPGGREIRWLAVAMGLAVVCCAAAPGLVAFMAALAAVGAMSIWLIARANAFVLLASEPRLRGQMMGIWSMALPGMSPLTGLAMGAAADAWGPRAALAGVGGAAVLAATAGWRTLREPSGGTSVNPVFTLSQARAGSACCPER